MFIRLDKTMPNGSSATHHYLDNLTITDATVTATVSSRTSTGTMCWQDRITIAAPLTGEPFTAALAVLTAPDAYLDGGIVMDDPTELDELRASLLTRLARLRDEKLSSGCVTHFGPIDTDLVSRQNISGAVAMATLAKAAGEAFQITWRMADNSYADLDADEMISVGVTVGKYVSAVYSVVFAIKDTVTAATLLDDLTALSFDEIAWP